MFDQKVLNNHGVLERPALNVQRLKDFFRCGVMSSGSSECLGTAAGATVGRLGWLYSRWIAVLMILVTAEHVLLQEAGADIMGLKTVSTQSSPEVIVILMSCDVFCTLVAVVHHR